MKKVLIVLALLCSARVARAAYFTTLFQNPKSPHVAAESLYTPAFKFDGAATTVAVVYHKADPAETIIPKYFLDLGVQPIAWTLVELGGGGNSQTGYAVFGASANFAPTLLGPAAKALHGSNVRALGTLADLLVAKDGNGLKVGLSWRADVISGGVVQPLDRWAFKPRPTFGVCYQF